MATSQYFKFRDVNPFLQGENDVSLKDSALIVIDAQNFYLAEGDWPVAGITETNKNIKALVDRYREAKGEIVWVVHTGDNSATLETIKGTPLDCIGDLRPQGNEHFIAKSQGSSFAGTDLHEYLQAKGIKKIVLVGYQPQFCVITTAVYGQHLGYRVFVVQDAIGSHHLRSSDNTRDITGAELVQSACDLMDDAIAVVIDAKDVKGR